MKNVQLPQAIEVLERVYKVLGLSRIGSLVVAFFPWTLLTNPKNCGLDCQTLRFVLRPYWQTLRFVPHIGQTGGLYCGPYWHILRIVSWKGLDHNLPSFRETCSWQLVYSDQVWWIVQLFGGKWRRIVRMFLIERRFCALFLEIHSGPVFLKWLFFQAHLTTT